MMLIIDNFDSFTYNLMDYMHQDGEYIKVVSYADPLLKDECHKADAIVFSPGPGHPADYPLLFEIFEQFKDAKPVLGVCLGMQVICSYYGWEVKKASKPMHGKTSEIEIYPCSLWEGLNTQIQVMRYHSLIVENAADSELLITAKTNENEVMAFAHKNKPIFGVQFHPESILSPDGKVILQNWMKIASEKKQFSFA